jgi:hypothetical protein
MTIDPTDDRDAYHRSLSRNPTDYYDIDRPDGRVYAHYIWHERDGTVKLSDKPALFFLKPGQNFRRYSTGWEQQFGSILDGKASPVVDVNFLTVLGYYDWFPGSVIWVPGDAPRTLTYVRTIRELDYGRGYRERKENTTVGLGLRHLLTNLYVDNDENPHWLQGPYPVYVSHYNYTRPDYVRWATPDEHYLLLTDLDGVVIAVTAYDVGGVKSPTNMEILIEVVEKVLVTRYVKMPFIKSLASPLWAKWRVPKP